MTVTSPSCRPGASCGEAAEFFSATFEAASSSLGTGQIHRGCKGSFSGGLEKIDLTYLGVKRL